jgi:hypothetical protein
MSINEQIKQLEEEGIAPLVDELMATEYVVAPPNPLVPEKTWKEQKRNELMNLFSGKKDFNRIDSALEAVRLDFQAHLAPIEQEKLSEEWELGVEKINDLLIQPAGEPAEESAATLPDLPLRKIMNISDESFELFYKTGIRYFQNQDFIKAADVFFLLSLIDYQKHNIWISLGLSEMKIQQFEPALNAFAMAAITKSDTPYPYIYSAECCIALGRAHECSTYLDLAREALSALPPEEKESLLEQINVLEQKS